jgi:diguanylate cyclase (GGDEF)-like protein
MLPVELERSKRYDDPTSLLLLDVDRFKQINDRVGHQEGDRVLVLLSGILTHGVRAADVICRYGGEEFAVILPHTDLEVAGAMAERIRERVATSSAQVEPPLRAGALTVTIGVAAFPAEAEDAEQLIAVADRRLYAGKARGKDCVVAGDG